MTFLSTEPKFSDSDNVLLGKILQQLITSPGGGGGGSQTPWTSNINAGGFSLAGANIVTATSFVGALTGNASTATILQTARTINGVSFNGSSNITLPAASQTPWTSDIDGANWDLNSVNTVVSVETAAQNFVVFDAGTNNLAAIIQFAGSTLSISDSLLTPQLTYNGVFWDFVNFPIHAVGAIFSSSVQFSGTTHFGLRINTLTTAQRNAIGVGVAGEIIWNSTTSRYDFNIGGSWKNFVRLDGDTMTGLLTVAQATANTAAFASTGYSLTGANAQSLIDLAGTWNTSGNPVALKLAITNTASGATSKFLSFLAGAAGATEVFSVDKAGAFNSVLGAGMNSGGSLFVTNGGINKSYLASTGLFLPNSVGVNFTANADGATSVDLVLLRDAANTLALRNSTNAQRFRLYNTFTTLDTAGEWFKFDWVVTANQFRFGAVQGSSSGTARVASWDYGAVSAGPTAAITVPATSGNIVFGGGVQLSNAAVTGLTAGVLSALTNASIVLYDSTGQAYRIPCII